jgi:hypothetical protein
MSGKFSSGEAIASALKSIKKEVVRAKPNRQELPERANDTIKNIRESTNQLMKKGLITHPPENILKNVFLSVGTQLVLYAIFLNSNI